MLRELACLIVVVVGAVLAIVGLVAAGWWALAILGGSALVCVGFVATAGRGEVVNGPPVDEPS